MNIVNRCDYVFNEFNLAKGMPTMSVSNNHKIMTQPLSAPTALPKKAIEPRKVMLPPAPDMFHPPLATTPAIAPTAPAPQPAPKQDKLNPALVFWDCACCLCAPRSMNCRVGS